MIRVIIADANVFAALFQADKLEALFSDQWLEVYITEEVFDELTNSLRRIAREFTDLPKLVRDARYRRPEILADGINVVNIEKEELTVEALSVYYELNEEKVLDLGEIESIPLAINKSATFVTSDYSAFEEMNGRENLPMGCSAELLIDFLTELRKLGAISQEEHDKIIELLNS